MTLAAFLGSALPYAFGLLVALGAWLYFARIVPWRNRRRERKAWDIHAM
jgi:hypothetical protein